MGFSKEVRLLKSKWDSNQGWPKRLEWVEIRGIRGWVGQRVDLRFPIVALVGENGVGKSTVLQAAASVYQSDSNERYASDFFPDTAWEIIKDASITFSFREGDQKGSTVLKIRKPTDRWRGNPQRPRRSINFLDLSRVQPIATRVGYARIAKSHTKETTSNVFEGSALDRLSYVMAKKYDMAKLSMTDIDGARPVPILSKDGSTYSGFHQGTGETGIAELIGTMIPKYSMLLVDEIEASLHPRAQRRIINDLAKLARELDLQILITTHSPYVLDELPPEARICLMDGVDGKQVITGISTEFAMTKMDDSNHPEAEIYVEDTRSETLLRELLIQADRDLVSRLRLIPFGAASVGRALGQMAANDRFPRPSFVFLDGDQEQAPGCSILPGEDAPERVVFEGLAGINWSDVCTRVGRSPSEVIDICNSAMTLGNHHEWVKYAADKLTLGSDNLWQAMCAAWATNCMNVSICSAISDEIKNKIGSSSTSSFYATSRPLPF